MKNIKWIILGAVIGVAVVAIMNKRKETSEDTTIPEVDVDAIAHAYSDPHDCRKVESDEEDSDFYEEDEEEAEVDEDGEDAQG